MQTVVNSSTGQQTQQENKWEKQEHKKHLRIFHFLITNVDVLGGGKKEDIKQSLTFLIKNILF